MWPVLHSPPLALQNKRMDNIENRERLAKSQAQMRRVSTWGFGSIAAGLLLCCAAAWWFTGDFSWMEVGLFLAPMIVFGLLYNHFVLLNPWRDPLETKKKLDARLPGGANARKTARWNGWIMVIASPLLGFIAIGKGIEEYGPWGALWGLAGAVFLVPGILSIRWGRSARESWWRG